MNWNNRFGFRGYFAFKISGIQIEGYRINVCKNRSCSHSGDCACCGKESKGRCDNFIAWPDTFRHERDYKRIRAGGYSDCGRSMTVIVHHRFKIFDLGAENKALGFANFSYLFKNFIFQAVELGAQVEYGYLHFSGTPSK